MHLKNPTHLNIMAQCHQLDLLQDFPEFRDNEISLIKMRVDNVQKGIFKRHSILDKKINTISENQEKYECRLYAIEKFLKDKFGEELNFDGTFGLM